MIHSNKHIVIENTNLMILNNLIILKYISKVNQIMFILDKLIQYLIVKNKYLIY